MAATYVPRAFGGTLILPPQPTQFAVYVLRSFGGVLVINPPTQYINVTWLTRDGKVTWVTRDEVTAWKTRG